MSNYMTILTYIAVGISLLSLFYTLRVAKTQKVIKGSNDTQITDKVQKHPYIRNPVFLAFIIFFVLLIFIIAYATFAIR